MMYGRQVHPLWAQYFACDLPSLPTSTLPSTLVVHCTQHLISDYHASFLLVPISHKQCLQVLSYKPQSLTARTVQVVRCIFAGGGPPGPQAVRSHTSMHALLKTRLQVHVSNACARLTSAAEHRQQEHIDLTPRSRATAHETHAQTHISDQQKHTVTTEHLVQRAWRDRGRAD